MEEPRVLYEDNHILVAFKPAGFLSQADETGKPDMLTWLKADIKTRYQKPGDVFLGLVHRLDQPVSGVMVFARTSKAAARLSEQIRQRALDKYYLAIVAHRPTPEAGRLEDYLAKDPATRQVSVCSPQQGQFAALDYQMVAYDGDHDCSLVQIKLETGRNHQIRVQFASRGWPLLGDWRYGDLSSHAKKPADNQPALFAQRLVFKHPTRDDLIDVALPLPERSPWTYFNDTISPARL